MNDYPLVQTKSFATRNAKDMGDNMIAGSASVMGVMDRSWWNDVICPGAFKNALSDFKKNGFVADGHAWNYAGVVAMPLTAEDRGRDLYCEAKFHSDQGSQDIRTKCVERMENGLSVGLSVGFKIADGGHAWFEKGEDLLAWAKGKGYDMSLFDVATIQAHEDECRAVSEISDLFEYSIVPVPANKPATATAVKQFDPGALNALRFEDHSDSVLTAVKGFLARARDYADTRAEKGRPLSEARRQEFEDLSLELRELLTLPASTDTERLKANARAVLALVS